MTTKTITKKMIVNALKKDLVLLNKQKKAIGAEKEGQPSSHSYPRLLVIDNIAIGSNTATGRVKKTFLGDWPQSQLLQIWQANSGSNGFRALTLDNDGSCFALSGDDVLNICRNFAPEAVYVRPTDAVSLEMAERVIETLGVPYAVHIMDDWPDRLRMTNSDQFLILDRSLKNLLSRASIRWSICKKMSLAYSERYGVNFESLANGVEINHFSSAKKEMKRPFIVRYMGGLANDMSFDSVFEIAQVISQLYREIEIEFHIHTMDWYRRAAETAAVGLNGVYISELVPWSQYYNAMSSSDTLVIAYNFDETSVNYTKFSLANKMPECLASGVPLLAYGPSDVATIEYLEKTSCSCVVNQRNPLLLKENLLRLATSPELRNTLASKARDFAARNLSSQMAHKRFRQGITRIAIGSCD